MFNRNIVKGVGVAVLATGFGTAAVAEEAKDAGLEEVVVTAQKRAQDLQKVAVSVATVSGEDVRQKGLVSMDDILKDVTNVAAQPIGFGSTISIRGMGWDLPVDVGEGAVATNFDGSFNSSVQSTLFGFYDLDRAEVLRGPQGTLYGRNATAGAVNIVSANPNTDKLGGYAVYELGNYSLQRQEGAVNVPLDEQFAARLAFINVNRAGYMSTGAGDAVGTAVRLKTLYKPSEDLQLVVSAERTALGGVTSDMQVTLANYDAGHPYLSTETSPLQKQDDVTTKYSANLVANAGPGVITFIPTYEWEEGRGTTYNQNTDVLSLAAGSNTRQRSAELRYGSLASSPIQWTGGLYYYDRQLTNIPDVDAQGPCAAGCNRGAKSKAVFGQVTYPLTDTLRLTGGGRYSDEIVWLQQPSNPAFADVSDSFKNFTWKAGIEYDFAQQVMGYATLATSTRPGGFNLGINTASTTFKQEDVKSAEAGLKSRFLDNRLQVNGSVFYYDYRNYQAVVAYSDPSLTPPIVVTFTNAPKASDYGAELETVSLFGQDTRLNLSLSYLHARYSAYFLMYADPNSPGIDVDGKPLTQSPDWTVKGSIDHRFHLANGATLTPSLSARWVDKHLVNPFPADSTTAKATALLDATVAYLSKSGVWGLNLWGKNLTDKVYEVSGSTTNATPAPPRTYGLNVNVNF